MQSIEILSLESIETKFSKPLIVGKDGVNKKSELTTFNTIKFSSEDTFGHGLLLNKKKQHKNWGFIADQENTPSLSKELQIAILKHAKHFSPENAIVKTRPSMDLYYATIDYDSNTTIYLESDKVVRNIRGYAGEVNIGVFIDNHGLLQGVEHIASKETQSYLNDIKKIWIL